MAMASKPIKIRKAIFPVAGYGTRFLPATKVSPKEMLPIVDKPLIQYATEEAIAAGIDTLIFVNGKHKRAIEDHYDGSPELSQRLLDAGKKDLLQQINQIKPKGVTCINIRQEEAHGLGDAILCAEKLIMDEPFAVLLADDFIMPNGSQNATKNLIESYQKYQSNILCVEHIEPQQTDQYGVIAGNPVGEDILEVTELVEKPQPSEAPSHIGIIGRYILQPSIFDHLKNIEQGSGGELQLTDAIKRAMSIDKLYAHICQGTRYDCGSKQGYLRANVEAGLKHPHLGDAFREYLKGRVKDL